MFACAAGGARLGRWLSQGTRTRWFDLGAGSAFIGASLLLGSVRN
jgi:threonine/homoserine/homoserine lactone efflux protein